MTTTARKPPRFLNGLFELDRILRGEVTRMESMRESQIRIPVLGISGTIVALAMCYGLCMGAYALIHGFENDLYQRAFAQTFASIVKVPLLYVLTLVVTFPSLYVFNALVGSQLRVMSVLKLLIASLGVNLAVLASMGPILAFFSASTPNYSFIVLLNVVLFSIAGILGLSFLVQTLRRLTTVQREPLQPQQASATPEEKDPSSVVPAELLEQQTANRAQRFGPLDVVAGVVPGRHVRRVFFCWMIVFGLVGAQMGWVLRPFIGSPNMPFEWFRERDSNFFQAVFHTLQNFLTGG